MLTASTEQVATIQPSIVEDFNDQGSLAWIGVSFVLGQVVILPVYVWTFCFSFFLSFPFLFFFFRMQHPTVYLTAVFH